MEIIKYNSEHYSLLLKWFVDYEWSPFPKTSISPNSFFVFQDNKPVAYSSIYFTYGTDIALLGFTIANKHIDKNIRNECIDFLMKHIENYTKQNGYNYIHYYTDANPMVNRLEQKHGYLVTDRGSAYILAKSLNGGNLGFLDE